MTTPPFFEHSETPYFHARSPRKMLRELARVQSLVLYCGAGVTIDRTSLGWADLIRQVFGNSDALSLSERQDIVSLLAARDPRHVASALYIRTLDQHKTSAGVQTHLTPLLANRLYKANGWQEGVLTRNVARLALYSAYQGQATRVFTTNYDTYLEKAMMDTQDEMEATLTAPIPGLQVRSIGVRKPIRSRKVKRGAPLVELTYLHGRVPEEGGHQGQIVLTEEDYEKTHKAVRTSLISALQGQGVGLLVLGSSLVDAPLLDALLATKDRGNRYALVPVESMGFTDRAPKDARRLTDLSRRRGDLFGIKISCPDFKFQIAQVCSELLLAITNPSLDVFADEARMRYGLRLVDWWNSWHTRGGRAPDESLWKQLSGLHAEVREIMEGASESARMEQAAGERTRVELWVRNNPEHSRSLVLWGTSEGPIKERGTLRETPLGLRTKNASVAAFLEGRPRHLTQEDLGRTHSDGRWRSFLAVPVFVGSPNLIADLPVGVVTLASTHEKGASLLPLERTGDMETLIEAMRQRGKSLLRPK